MFFFDIWLELLSFDETEADESALLSPLLLYVRYSPDEAAEGKLLFTFLEEYVEALGRGNDDKVGRFDERPKPGILDLSKKNR